MKMLFVTGNEGKFAQVRGFLKGVEVEKLDVELREMQSLDQEEVVRDKALQALEIAKKPVVVEDTGIYFNAFPKFPGTLTKLVFKALGFKGIFKLLEGGDRRAYFKTIAAYASPGKEVKLFEGVLDGKISTVMREKVDPHLPFMQVFIPKGFDVPYVDIPEKDKARVTHRAKAFYALRDYLMGEGK